MKDKPMLDEATALKLIRGKPWHHDFEIVEGVRTKDAYDPTALWRSGETVLFVVYPIDLLPLMFQERGYEGDFDNILFTA